MAFMTDPARELGEIAQRLIKGTNTKGASFLATEFGVAPWSASFFKIVACILERADTVAVIVQRSNMYDDHKQSAVEELDGFKSAFAGASLVNSWNNAGHGLSLMQKHCRSIQFLSPVVGQSTSYPQLDDEEVKELIDLIDRYTIELNQSDEVAPFVRQAILDGLALFRFQLEKMGWMGAGYALAAFREVMRVYDTVQREEYGTPDLDAWSALKGLGTIITKFKESVDKAKSWTDAGEAVWKAYQLGSAVATPLLLTTRIGGS